MKLFPNPFKIVKSKSQKVAPTASAKSNAEARKHEEEEARKKADEELQDLLPWELENKIAFIFSVVKVPFILFVCFFGTLTEWQVRDLTLGQWARDKVHDFTGPSCFVHTLDMERFPEHASFSLIKAMNETLMFGTLGQKPKVDFGTINLELANKDMCGFQDESCRPDLDSVRPNSGGGAMHRIPLALLWGLYKLLFVGIHPVDRIMRKLFGMKPYLKLLTEPHMQRSWFGVCRVFFIVVVKAFWYLRYKFLPNVLVTALATMEMHPFCKNLLVYRYDWFWNQSIYVWIVFDTIVHSLLYYKMSMTDDNMIGTWKYRVYKVFWFLSNIFVLFLAVSCWMTTVQWNPLQFFRFCLELSFTFDISFAFYVDFLQAFLFFIVFLETLEFWSFVLQICCPKMAAKWFRLEQLDNLTFILETAGGTTEEEELQTEVLLADASDAEAGVCAGRSQKPPSK